MITIRNMQLSDFPVVMQIQSACYTDIIPESSTSMLAKLLASPSSCFVATRDEKVLGYLISLPWEFANPPALDMQTCELPPHPDCLYLHDLAIAPDARKFGAAAALVEAFLAQLPAQNLSRASLIAIQNSAAYWSRYGFVVADASNELQAKIASYGDHVFYMVKPHEP